MIDFSTILGICFILVYVGGISCIIISMIVDKDSPQIISTPTFQPQKKIIKVDSNPNFDFNYDEADVIISSDNDDDSITV